MTTTPTPKKRQPKDTATARPNARKPGRARGGRKDTTSPRTVRLEMRENVALNLRMQGGGYRIIAATMRDGGVEGVPKGYNPSMAFKDVIGALNRLNSQYAEQADAYRRLELERLDVMWAAMWPYAEKGDAMAIERCLRLMGQRARYIPNLYVEEKSPKGVISVGVSGSSGPPTITEVLIELQVPRPQETEGV